MHRPQVQAPNDTYWIADGGFLMRASRSQPFDYVKLKAALTELSGAEKFRESHYFSAEFDNTISTDGIAAFHSWLQRAAPDGPHMRVHVGSSKLGGPRTGSSYQGPKSSAVALTTEMLTLAMQPNCKRIILSAGDAELEPPIRYITSVLGKDVWLNGSRATIALELQPYAREFIWLDDIRARISKDWHAPTNFRTREQHDAAQNSPANSSHHGAFAELSSMMRARLQGTAESPEAPRIQSPAPRFG